MTTTIASNPEPRTRLVGVAALVATVVLWSSFALSSRGIGESSLTLVDAALIRFAVPVFALIPWLPRAVRQVRRLRVRTVVLVLAGGLPHFLLFAIGARLTSAGLTGLLVPGTVPLFVAILLAVRSRTPISAGKGIALGLIVLGVVATSTMLGDGATIGGFAVLLTAGFVWAVYTIGLQRSGLDLTSVILLVAVGSAAGAAVLAVTGALPSHLLSGSARVVDVVGFAAVQGIGTGLLSTLCYAVAVRRLGGATSAVAGALSPVLTAAAAVPLFGEPVSLGFGLGLGLVVLGVVLFNLRIDVLSGRRLLPKAKLA